MCAPATCAVCKSMMKTGWISLGICGLILIFLPVMLGSSPPRQGSHSKATNICGAPTDKSTPIWKRIQCYMNETRHISDVNNTFKRTVQLHSRASRRHIQIMKTGIDARGRDGSEYARTVLESDTFGRIKIRGEKSKRYLCINKKGDLVARVQKSRFTTMKRCIFREEITSQGYNQYRSVRYPQWYIGFSKGGRPRNGSKSAKRQKFRQFTTRKLPDENPKGKRRRDAQLRRRLIRRLKMRYYAQLRKF